MFIKSFLLFIVLLAFGRLPAQLCQGSLGDPIVNKTFGTGPNPGPSLGATTNMIFNGADCPGDGFYTITNSTSQCFGDTWHTLTQDHTGDPNGYFMLINASLVKSEFYVDTVHGLCPNTTYEFAAWITNVILPSACQGNSARPNLTFTIQKTDGTLLQSYNTGDILPTSITAWNQSGFFFTTPPGASDVILRIQNNSNGGCGNDLGIDDITFRPCGPLLTGYINDTIQETKEFCVGTNANVKLSVQVSSGYTDPYFQWQQSNDGITWQDIPGANSVTYLTSVTAGMPAGAHFFRLTVAEFANRSLATCRIASSVLTIRINNKPVPSATSNSPVCIGSKIVLSASDGTDYKWTGVNNFSASGSPAVIEKAAVTHAGKYYVSVTSDKGCTQTDSVVVSLLPSPVAAVAFTNKAICEGESVELSSSGGGTYQWFPPSGLSDPNISDPVAKPAGSTAYTVVVDNGACTDSATVAINVLTTPKADAGPDQYILEGHTIQLQATATGGNLSYDWSPPVAISNSRILQPVVSPVSSTVYYLSVVSGNGCGTAYDSARIYVYKNVIVPNAFSPNGDGINDTWNITALTTYNNYELSVFNRYGRVVYTTKDYSHPWNGTYNGRPLPVGTYYYLIDLKVNLPVLKGYVLIIK